MFNPTYLTLSRSHIFYLRYPIPRHVHPLRKSSNIKASLGTRDPRAALRLARCLAYAGSGIVAHGIEYGMQYEDIRRTLHEHFSLLLAARQRTMQASGPLGALDIAALDTSISVSAGTVAGHHSLGLVDDDTALLGEFIDRYQLPIRDGTREYELLRGELHKSYRDYCKAVLAHHQSFGHYEFGPALQTFTPAAHGKTPTAPLSEIAEKFTAEEIRAGRWVKRTEDQKRHHLSLLQKILGPDTEARSISGEQVRTVKGALLRLPRNMNKNPATRNRSLDELLAAEHVDKLTIRTVNSYLQTYSGMFTWATNAKLADDDPFAKSLIRENKRQVGKRQAFTEAQLQIIEAALLNEETSAKPKEAHKWASLIAIYTGARLNEVCQLTVSDILEYEGIWCFNLNDEGDGKHLKNEASIRIVPIHSRLIALGVLDYVSKLKRNLSPKLFPEYSYTPNLRMGKEFECLVQYQVSR